MKKVCRGFRMTVQYRCAKRRQPLRVASAACVLKWCVAHYFPMSSAGGRVA